MPKQLLTLFVFQCECGKFATASSQIQTTKAIDEAALKLAVRDERVAFCCMECNQISQQKGSSALALTQVELNF